MVTVQVECPYLRRRGSVTIQCYSITSEHIVELDLSTCHSGILSPGTIQDIHVLGRATYSHITQDTKRGANKHILSHT